MICLLSKLEQYPWNHRGEGDETGGRQAREGEIEPAGPHGPVIEAALHPRPQVAAQRTVSHGWHGALQKRGQFLFLPIVHSSIPISFSSLRSSLTARNSRDFTASTVMPRAVATSAYGCCSTSTTVATHLSFTGNL